MRRILMRYPHCDRRKCGIFSFGPWGLICFIKQGKTMTQTKTRASPRRTDGSLPHRAELVKLLELRRVAAVCIGMQPIFSMRPWGCK